jgi:hypothetical protein
MKKILLALSGTFLLTTFSTSALEFRNRSQVNLVLTFMHAQKKQTQQMPIKPEADVWHKDKGIPRLAEDDIDFNRPLTFKIEDGNRHPDRNFFGLNNKTSMKLICQLRDEEGEPFADELGYACPDQEIKPKEEYVIISLKPFFRGGIEIVNKGTVTLLKASE